MTFLDLASLFIRWGYLIKPHHYKNFELYFKEMLRRNRVMIVQNDTEIQAVLTYFLTDDYETLYKKSHWDIPRENPEGHQIYVDKMICKNWKVPIRRIVQDLIEDSFPNVMEGHYHRAPYDRHIKIMRRRREHGIQNSSLVGSGV